MATVGKCVSGLLEKSRSRKVDGLGKFIVVDNHEAVRVGGTENRVPTEFSGAVIWEGADELTLRAQEESVVRTFIDTSNVGDGRWEASFS